MKNGTNDPHIEQEFMKPITVLLAEDHMVVRQGLHKLLEAEDDLEVVGEAETGRQAVAMTLKLRPAVVVMDIAMPLLNGLEASRQILKHASATKILILSAHSDDAYVERALEFGAKGFLLKQTSAHVLSRAIREVQKGNVFFTPSIAKRLAVSKPLCVQCGQEKGRPIEFTGSRGPATHCRRQSEQTDRSRTGH